MDFCAYCDANALYRDRTSGTYLCLAHARLEVIGAGESLAREVEITTVLGLRMDVVDTHHVNQVCTGRKVSDVDPGAVRSDLRDLAGAGSRIS